MASTCLMRWRTCPLRRRSGWGRRSLSYEISPRLGGAQIACPLIAEYSAPDLALVRLRSEVRSTLIALTDAVAA
jgi:hypothetical protein